ncbi:MAG: NAD(P)H-dependent oxidoreductase [Candidatus Saccharimonadales bacterium]
MPKVIVVTGSVRPNSVNENVVPLVVSELEKQKAEVTVADLKEMNLPFFDAPLPPTAPDFEAPHESVRAWTKRIDEADGVVLVTPEYNHTMTPVQLNAIDWIGKEWTGKPVALVGYGWRSGALQAHATAREALAVNLKAAVGDVQTNLYFTKELNPDGSVADQAAVDVQLEATVAELLATISV